jgi:hypothetical protein
MTKSGLEILLKEVLAEQRTSAAWCAGVNRVMQSGPSLKSSSSLNLRAGGALYHGTVEGNMDLNSLMNCGASGSQTILAATCMASAGGPSPVQSLVRIADGVAAVSAEVVVSSERSPRVTASMNAVYTGQHSGV